MDTISSKVFLYIVIVVSATFHEYMHGWMAYRLGDPTAKNEGRLTLNPIAHIDPLGTVILPILFMFSGGGFIGWAKPVPYNPHFLRDPKYGSLKVAAAGPGANLVIAVFLGLLFRLGGIIPAFGVLGGDFFYLLAIIIYVNISLMLFNLIPLPPLDGSKIFADLFPRQWRAVMNLGFFGVLIALFIAFYFLGPLAGLTFWAITGSNFF